MALITRTRVRIAGFAVVALLIASAATLGVLAWHKTIAPIAPPAHTTFAQAAIDRGAALAALGDCAVCHTKADGRPYAGGRGVATPFGVVYATNITPDPETGIGRWSLAAFQRAMRDGIDRDGQQLYPVLPYPHFVQATDTDISAIYAFLMTRAPVQQAAPPNGLQFPFSWRPLLAGWNLIFLHSRSWQSDATKDAEWNRGAYLVEAIGHCGACHTPHNWLGAEQGG